MKNSTDKDHINNYKTYKLIRFEPQELIDLGYILALAWENEEIRKDLANEWAVSEDRMRDLMDKIRKHVDGL